jgi:hypothetical protein
LRLTSSSPYYISPPFPEFLAAIILIYFKINHYL